MWKEVLEVMYNHALVELLGINITSAFAGAMGGVVGAWADGKAGFAAWISYVGAGMITANYLADQAAHLTGVTQTVGGFVVGLAALVIVKAIIAVIKKWHPRFNGSQGETP